MKYIFYMKYLYSHHIKTNQLMFFKYSLNCLYLYTAFYQKVRGKIHYYWSSSVIHFTITPSLQVWDVNECNTKNTNTIQTQEFVASRRSHTSVNTLHTHTEEWIRLHKVVAGNVKIAAHNHRLEFGRILVTAILDLTFIS